MGAINTQAHLAKIESYVEIGKSEGARLVAGGEPGRPAIDQQLCQLIRGCRQRIRCGARHALLASPSSRVIARP